MCQASSTHPHLTRFGGFCFFWSFWFTIPSVSLNNWHLLRQQRKQMAHDTKFYNSDNSAAPASRHGRRSHAFKSDWYQHDPCTEEQAEWLIQCYR
ncbi:hypothetical protein S37_1860, partial [Escherichia coli B109]